MSEIQIKAKPVHGVVAIVIAVLVLGMRFATIGETDDPKLIAAIRSELVNELGGRIGQDLEQLDPRDENAVAALTRRADMDAIEVKSVRVSRPIFSFSSEFEAVVRVDYTLPGSEPQTAYWRVEHSATAGWRYPQHTAALFYYLNFV